MTDENNEMPQAMWKHLGELVQGLEQRLKARFDALDIKVDVFMKQTQDSFDALEIKVDVFMKQTQDNFSRVQRNFDRVGLGGESIGTSP